MPEELKPFHQKSRDPAPTANMTERIMNPVLDVKRPSPS